MSLWLFDGRAAERFLADEVNVETGPFPRPKFRKDDLVPLCDSCTMICALDRRTELQTVNRLSRVDFQGQVMPDWRRFGRSNSVGHGRARSEQRFQGS